MNLFRPLFVFLVLLLCNACDKETTPPSTQAVVESNLLAGDWSAKFLSCFCTSPPEYETGEYVWDFNFTDMELTVSENLPDSILFVYENGVYPIIDFSEPDQTITIEANSFQTIWDYSFDGDELVLSNHPEVDGPLIQFEEL